MEGFQKAQFQLNSYISLIENELFGKIPNLEPQEKNETSFSIARA